MIFFFNIEDFLFKKAMSLLYKIFENMLIVFCQKLVNYSLVYLCELKPNLNYGHGGNVNQTENKSLIYDVGHLKVA